MSTFRDLITGYGLAAFADDIGVPLNTAKQMRRRSSVPSEYWQEWIDRARARGRWDISAERLAAIAAERRAQLVSAQPEGVGA